jgi:hypothetical protein
MTDVELRGPLKWKGKSQSFGSVALEEIGMLCRTANWPIGRFAFVKQCRYIAYR